MLTLEFASKPTPPTSAPGRFSPLYSGREAGVRDFVSRMHLQDSNFRFGLGLVLLAVAIPVGWAVYALVSVPHSTGSEIKDGAVFSVLPFTLAMIFAIWGVVMIHQATRR